MPLTPKLTLPQAAKRLEVKASVLYRWCAAKKVPHLRVGRAIYFDAIELQQWWEQRKQPVVEPARHVTRREGGRTREEECEALGIPVEHEFS